MGITPDATGIQQDSLFATECRQGNNKAGIGDEYLAQPIVKAQNRRAYELITTITRTGDDTTTAILTDLAGEEVEVMITPAVIAEITKR